MDAICNFDNVVLEPQSIVQGYYLDLLTYQDAHRLLLGASQDMDLSQTLYWNQELCKVFLMKESQDKLVVALAKDREAINPHVYDELPPPGIRVDEIEGFSFSAEGDSFIFAFVSRYYERFIMGRCTRMARNAFLKKKAHD